MKQLPINDRHSNKGAIYFYLPLIFILMPSLPSVLPELLGFQIIFALEVMVVLSLYKKVYRPKRNYNYIIILFYFIAATIFSLLNDVISGVIIPSDYFELIKPFAFILFYWLYRYSVIDVGLIERNTLKAIWVIFIFLSIWSVLSFIFPTVFYPLEILLYKRESMSVLRGKAIGSFSQTYHFAYTLLLPLAMSFIMLIQKFSVKYVVLSILFLCAMLLTQSRSMYICTVICLLVCMFLPIHYRNIKTSFKTIILISIVIISIIGVISHYFEELSSILNYAVNGLKAMLVGENNSVNIRQSQVQWSVDNNPYMLIGAGIGKGEKILESFYSLYYYRYGIIGVAISLFIMLYTAVIAYRIAKREYFKDTEKSLFYYALFVFYAITPIAILSSCHMDSPKISFLFYGLIGMIHAKYTSMQRLHN